MSFSRLAGSPSVIFRGADVYHQGREIILYSCEASLIFMVAALGEIGKNTTWCSNLVVHPVLLETQ